MQKECHVVDYKIIGESMQLVEVELDPGEAIVAEAGAMMYMDEGIRFDAKLGDGSKKHSGLFGKILGVSKRAMMGESFFMTHFTYEGEGKGHVAFAAPYPGSIVPVDLSYVGGRLLCQQEAFLCAAMGTVLDVAIIEHLGTGFFGGEGFILQEIKGDGMAFIHAGGTVIQKELNDEVLIVDTGCLVAFQPTLDYSIKRSGSIKSMAFGGEGLFLATLKGTGRVLLQSLPFSRMADRILASAPKVGGKKRGES